MATLSWETTKIRHGTASGCRLHQKLGERPCEACYNAKAAYDKRYRSAPRRVQQSRLSARAQIHAYQVLARDHPEEYHALYRSFKAKFKAEENIGD